MNEILDQGPFPWRDIAKWSLGTATVAAAGLIALVAAARKQERSEYAERNRVRWTDAARWER